MSSTEAKLCVMVSRFDKRDYKTTKMVSRTQTSKTVQFESSSDFIMNNSALQAETAAPLAPSPALT